MKKIAVILVALTFLGSGFAISCISRNGTLLAEDDGQENVIEKILHFPEPTIEKKGMYAVVKSTNANTALRKEGHPFLPSYIETLTLPIGTEILGIEVQTSQPKEISLSEKITPTAPAISYNMKPSEVKIVESDVYKSNNIYPENMYEWNAGVGIENGERIVFLSIQLYPIRYIPASNKLLYTDEIKIKVKYEPPEKPLLQNDVYDLIIIAPSEFSDALQPLVNHKESHGIKTKLVTLNEIYGSVYFPSQGRDDEEEMMQRK
ncbi:MAG: hypothetical protein FE048_05145 [Thermoplasmata archaeon]|nr:MAG: hypothetical protein FE048_05145 [Thermoplasmata archaeon]